MMTTDKEIRERQARCQQHLGRLRMLARNEPGALPPQLAAAEISRATNAILAEVTAGAPTAVPRYR